MGTARTLSLLGLAAITTGGCIEDPFDVPAPSSCEVADQNEWVLGVMEEFYLWSAELPVVDPRTFDSPEALMSMLRFQLDRWSGVSDKVKSDALFKEGMVISFGLRTRRDDAGDVRVATVVPGSSAAEAQIQRTDRLIRLNDLTIAEIDENNLWNQVWGESQLGVTVDVVVESLDGIVREVTLTKDWVEIVTVPEVKVLNRNRRIGYIAFETFVEPAKEALDAAFADLSAAGVEALVVDLRYNGGGLLSVAGRFANLIGGLRADGHEMYRIEYNANNAASNTTHRFTRAEGSLDIHEVVFLTTGTTLSASELVINALRPYLDVRIVGTPTGGKPFGSRSFEFCDKVLFPLTFRLTNADGLTDYVEGFAPDCAAIDDLDHTLGDADEASLREGLSLLETGACSTAAIIDQPSVGDRFDTVLDQVHGGLR